MNCPSCGSEVSGLRLVVGVVRITTKVCKCGRSWRERHLLIDFIPGHIEDALLRLQRKYPGHRTPAVNCAIHYLQSKLDDHAASKLERDAATRKRRADFEERQFLKQAMDEVY